MTSAEAPRTFDCRSCGATLTFAPGTDRLECEYCGSMQEIGGASAAGEVLEYDLADALRSAPRRAAKDLVQNGTEVCCQGCGARTVFEGQAGSCPYCDSPVVIDVQGGDEAVIAPESVLPFEVSAEEAHAAFRRWVAGLWFAPSDLVKRAAADRIDGVYLPYWTFDAQATSRYRGERGDDYQESERYTDAHGHSRTRQVTRTRWSRAAGTVRVSFDDVLVCANEALPRDLVERLEPWDLQDLRPYDPSYLSGFTAERYAVDLPDAWRRGQERMVERIRVAVRADIGGDRQRIHDLDNDLAAVTFKLCLLPLWISSFRYGGEVYRFLVNARTGEVAGKRPWSVIKIVLAVLAGLMVTCCLFMCLAAAGGLR